MEHCSADMGGDRRKTARKGEVAFETALGAAAEPGVADIVTESDFRGG